MKYTAMRLPILVSTLFAVSFTAFSKENNPLFIENKGQVTDQFHNIRRDIDITMDAGAMNIFIGNGEIHYQFINRQVSKNETGQQNFQNAGLFITPLDVLKIDKEEAYDFNTYRLDVEVLNANKKALLVKEDRQPYYENYYTSPFGKEGLRASSFQKITYKDIYPHIDWLLYVKDGQLEHEFIIKEGGNPADIKLRYKGANSLKINTDGSFTATTPLGTVTERSPVSIQADGKEVKTTFVLENDVLSFDIADYEGTLIIDPFIEWATYYRGTVNDPIGNSKMTVDLAGNIYMCGGTTYTAQVATVGAHDVSYAGVVDAYVAKFNGNGTRKWGTYYGGVEFDKFNSIAYDNNGCVVAAGSTSSATDIATNTTSFQGPPSTSIYSGTDGFIVKFDTNGNRIWGSYFGSSEGDVINELVCDVSGNIYMTGSTSSTSNISTIGAHQTGNNGMSDGFLVKLDNTGQILWATYCGGSGSDGLASLCLSGNTIYVCGVTASSNGIATPGTYQSTKPPLSNNCGFIAAFNNAGTRLWGTYLSGNTPEMTALWCIAVNSNDELFVAGFTDETSGLTTSGSHQETYAGNIPHDGVIARFTNIGNRVWCTYYGGEKSDWINGISCNNLGELYVVGATFSANNIAINAFQSTYSGPLYRDALMAKLTNAGTFIWGSYLGGTWQEEFDDIVVGANSELYMCGGGGSFPTTPGCFMPNAIDMQVTLSDHYLIKFVDFPSGVQKVVKESQSLSLYPNPNTGSFTIRCTTLSNEKTASIEVTDILGKTVQRTEASISNGSIIQEINLSNELARGAYILKIHTVAEEQSKRFVIK